MKEAIVLPLQQKASQTESLKMTRDTLKGFSACLVVKMEKNTRKRFHIISAQLKIMISLHHQRQILKILSKFIRLILIETSIAQTGKSMPKSYRFGVSSLMKRVTRGLSLSQSHVTMYTPNLEQQMILSQMIVLQTWMSRKSTWEI